jgi:carboxymethylenebutenolidase
MRVLAMLTSLLMLSCTQVQAQEWARKALEKSPRHGEWVTVKNGARDVKCFVVYPESKAKTSSVLVIHEIFGLAEWPRLLADEVAAAGYIAIAPDLLSGTAPGGGGTAEYPNEDAVRKAIQTLPPDQITGDLNAAYNYVKKLPAANGKVAVTGYCWGGTQSFRYANNNKDLKAAYVFYGTGPDTKEGVANITAPVYGFYAENDARVNATLAKTTEIMKGNNKVFDPKIYAGGGHGFMRAGEAPDASEGNKTARAQAWARWKTLLKKM